MEATLPTRDFCYRHLADATLPPVITTHQHRPISKVLWLTLLVSVLLHLALIWWWAEQPSTQVSTKARPLLISLVTPVEQASIETAAPETTMAEHAPDTPIAEPAPTAEQMPVVEVPVTAEPPAELNLRLPVPAVDNSRPHSAPGQSGTVFHPGLRGQIQSARSTRERLHNNDTPLLNSWQDASGSTWVDMGNGLCMRSAGEADGFTQNWELPTQCGGQFTESERMLRNIQRDVDRQIR